MRKLMLVANPSSSGFTGSLFRDVVSTLGREFDVMPIWPVNPAEARERAIEAVERGIEIVVAMGGDGVVHHVGNGLIGSGTGLGIVPVGTTNVVARLYGLPRNPVAAAERLLEATPTASPAALVKSDSEFGARLEHALFATGVGFDADVVEVAEQRPQSKLWFGSLHYARAAVGRVMGPYRGKPAHLTVEADGDTMEAIALFVQVHRHYTYFGRIPMTLGTAGEEGPLAAAVARLDARLGAGILARLMLRRDLARMDEVTRWSNFERVVVRSTDLVPFQADGEHLGHASTIEVTPVDEALLVLR